MLLTHFQKLLIRILFISLLLFFHQTAKADVETSSTPSQCLSLLLEGNDHFVKGEMQHLPNIAEAKDRLLESQSLMAVVVSCSDSRVVPNLIFDRTFGELFAIRIVGNVIGPIELNSVEFGVDKLKAPLVMVLGHQNCGAIKTYLSKPKGESNFILSLIDQALKNCKKPNILDNAIRCNVKYGVETLKKSPTIAKLIEQGKVKIVGAYFDFDTSKVSLITD